MKLTTNSTTQRYALILCSSTLQISISQFEVKVEQFAKQSHSSDSSEEQGFEQAIEALKQ